LLNKQPLVAMVGARNASLNGRRYAEKLARELGEAGIIVVSGSGGGH
jgi:DNA processing protein